MRLMVVRWRVGMFAWDVTRVANRWLSDVHIELSGQKLPVTVRRVPVCYECILQSDSGHCHSDSSQAR